MTDEMRRVVFAVEHPDNDTEKHGDIWHGSVFSE